MRKSPPSRPPVNLRRAYLESRYGQLHVRTAFPSTGGFDERRALICLHEFPHSSRGFAAFLPEMGTDRSVYACDAPGFGESDPPHAVPSIGDYAAAIGDFLDGLRLREVDLLGYRGGAAIAVEVAIQRPAHVKHLVCVGLPCASASARASFEAERWPLPAAADGSHLLRDWQRVAELRGATAGLDDRAALYAAALGAGPVAWWGTAAVLDWPAAARLAQLRQPTLVLRPADLWRDQTARAAALVQGATLADLDDCGGDAFVAAPAEIARRLRAFVDC